MPDQSLEKKLTAIGERLFNLRHDQGSKLETVANAIGVTHSVLSKIEHGYYEGLSIRLLHKIAEYYQADIRALLS